jgi:hypothetical protein
MTTDAPPPRRFTEDEIRALIECERGMDEGRIAFVMLDGQRVSVTAAAMAEFGLAQGQTINVPIMIALLEFNIAHCQAQIAIEKASASASRKKAEPES